MIQVNNAQNVNVVEPGISYDQCSTFNYKCAYFNKNIDEFNYTILNIVHYHMNLDLFKNLTRVNVNCRQAIPINFLSKNLRTLVVHNSLVIRENVLPSNLNKLILGNTFNNPISVGILPYNLKTLIFENYTREIEINVLPLNLKKLTLGHGLIEILKKVFTR
jgi:hypothetical protein